jgi:hypothetical protein
LRARGRGRRNAAAQTSLPARPLEKVERTGGEMKSKNGRIRKLL